MKITANGGTDGGNIVLFWPDSLPDDADAVLTDDPITLVEALQKEGKLIWFPCDGDGGYSVSIYVRTEVPEELLTFCCDEETYPTLVVRGDGYFGGMEYMFKRDDSMMKRYPGMCERVAVPEGIYAATVFQTDVPEELFYSSLRGQAGEGAMRVWEAHGVVAAGTVVGVLAALIGVFFFPWLLWFAVVGLTAGLACAALLLSRTRQYKAVEMAEEEFEREYPSYVVRLV